MLRSLLAVLLLLVLAAPARAASASGTFALERAPGSVLPAGHASWAIDGAVVGARAEAPKVGLAPDDQLIDTDLRYVHATLTAAHRDRKVYDCGDGAGGTTTETYDGVAGPSSAFETELVLDELHGRGTAELSVAESPWPGGDTRAFAPGTTHYGYHSTCYGSIDDRGGDAAVVGDDGFFALFGVRRLSDHLWTLRRGRDGAWRLAGTHRWSDVQEDLTATAALTFRGSGPALDARCVVPRIRDLARARTARAARAVLRRAGFPRVRVGAKHTRAARRGRFFVLSGMEEMGGQAVRCGWGGLRLVRSLGWP